MVVNTAGDTANNTTTTITACRCKLTWSAFLLNRRQQRQQTINKQNKDNNQAIIAAVDIGGCVDGVNHPAFLNNNNNCLTTPTTTKTTTATADQKMMADRSLLSSINHQRHPPPPPQQPQNVNSSSPDTWSSSWSYWSRHHLSIVVITLFLLILSTSTTSVEAIQSQADGPLSWQQVRPSCTNTTMALLNATIPFVFRSSHLQVFDNYTFSCYGFISTVYFYVHKEPNEDLTVTKPFYLDIWDRLPNKANWFRLVNSTVIYPSSAYVGWHWYTLPPAQRIPVGPGGIVGIHQETTSLDDNLISVGHYETVTSAPLPMKIQSQLKNGVVLSQARVAPLSQGDLCDRRGYSFYLPDSKGLRLPGLYVDVTTITDDKVAMAKIERLLGRSKRQTSPVFVANGGGGTGGALFSRNTNNDIINNNLSNNNDNGAVIFLNTNNDNNRVGGGGVNNINNGVSCGDPPIIQGTTLVFQSWATGSSHVGDYVYYQCPQQLGGGYSMTSCNADGSWCCMPLCMRRNTGEPGLVTRTFRFTPPPTNLPPAGPGVIIQPQPPITEYEIQPKPQYNDIVSPQQRVTVTLIPPVPHARQPGQTVMPYLAVYDATPPMVGSRYGPMTPPTLSQQQASMVQAFNGGTCGAPPRVPNAIVVSTTVQKSFSQSQPGDTVEYACLPGYQPLSYTNTFTCSSNDYSWVGTVGCTPASSGDSNSQLDGYRTATIWLLPSTTQATPNYKNGCMPPVIIENGYVYYQSFGANQEADIRPGDFVTYECRQGYVLVGQKTVRCTSTGWGIAPMCVPQVGPGPINPPVTLAPYTSGPPPTTVPITCGSAPAVPNAVISQSSFDSFRMSKPGDTVEYACIAGFEQAGLSRTIACLTNGRWSELPYCVVIPTTRPTTPQPITTPGRLVNCGSAPFVPNARIRYQSFQSNAQVNDIVMYDCLVGYSMSGLSTIACMSSGKWTIAPSCVPPTDKDELESETTEFDETFTTTRTSLLQPALADQTAIRRVKMRLTEKLARGKPDVNLELPLETSDLVINEKPVPGSSPFALAHWQSSYMAIPPDECLSPPYVDSARIVYQTYPPGQPPRAGNYVVYGCVANHRLIGSSVVWCQGAIAGWTTTPFCIFNMQFMDFPTLLHAATNRKRGFIGKSQNKVSGCGFAPDITNARIVDQSFSGNGSRFGDYVTYECRQGFITPGSAADLSPQFSIKCLPTNAWSSLPSGCIPRASCGAAPLVTNGFIVGQSFESSNSRPDDRVQYDCQVGSRIQGTPYIICMQNGQWTPTPICNRGENSCGQLPTVRNAEISYTSIPAGQQAQPGHVIIFKCTNNAQMQGPGMVRCTADGSWSSLPSCSGDLGWSSDRPTSFCGAPPVVQHASVLSGDYSQSRPGDVATYQCDIGYMFDTGRTYSEQIVCGPDGTWSPPPICRLTQNSPPQPGQTGLVTRPSTGSCADTHLVVLADFQWSSFFQDNELDAAQQVLKQLPTAILAAMGRNEVPVRRMKITLSTTRISAMSASQMMSGGAGTGASSSSNYGIAPASVLLNPSVSTLPTNKETWDRWVDYNVKTFLYPLSRELSSALYDVGNRLLANDTGIEVDTSGRSASGKPARRVLVITSANRGQSIVDAYDAVRALQADVGVIAVTQYVQSPVLGRLLKNNIAVPSSNFIYLDTISALKAELNPDMLGATTRNLLCL